jgi:Uncharacterized conserved protein (DUF2075)
MRQAYFHSTIENFLKLSDDEILGILNKANTQFSSQWTITTTSWDSLLIILKESFSTLISLNQKSKTWSILLEYEIPRLQSRIDAVIIAHDIIFVLEFKYERKKFELADIRQAEDYALDLFDFHMESRERTITPILLAPKANSELNLLKSKKENQIIECLLANSKTLPNLLLDAFNFFHNKEEKSIDAYKWEQSEYKPTPTIIQAAKTLFAGQKVQEISNYGADNLSKTSKYLIQTVKEAIEQNKKVVCFVTGVPGAGKTLVGLDVVHEKEEFGGTESNTAYFSGNVPLINVLRHALSKDNYEREVKRYKEGHTITRPLKKDSERKVKAKIQNLHQFIKESIRKKTAPDERIVVFDEAQRCWNAKQFSNKSKQNQNRETNPFAIEEKSEAELIFEFMSRHKDWAVIIALIGGGQEINTGEGGISEWGKALQTKYQNWEVHVSPELVDVINPIESQNLFSGITDSLKILKNESLHLSVSQRSFKAASLNNWVAAVLDNNPVEARKMIDSINNAYPIIVTRSIEKAKEWLRQKKAGNKRIGMLASSGGLRLKPYGIQVREEVDEALWFLNDEMDVRSSHYLEITATEYKVQGLEIDWACICWDADLRRNKNEWNYKSFSGTTWQVVNGLAEQQFLLNTYRVLLTRAREGIIIFVPEGDEKDYTRDKEFYDPTFEYLKSCGAKVLDYN